jgi:hypothetical protein
MRGLLGGLEAVDIKEIVQRNILYSFIIFFFLVE